MSVRTAKSVGKNFELQVQHDLLKIFSKKHFVIEKDVHLDIGIQVDFLVKDEFGIIEVVEAKGGDHPIRKDGGARRTDNVKKAIANASLYKGIFPNSRFVVYFSYKPALSFHRDTVLWANEMNRFTNLDNKLKYDFLLNIIRAQKRPYSKWHKKAQSSDLSVVKEYYGYSDAKAEEALKILSDDQITAMKKQLYKGD